MPTDSRLHFHASEAANFLRPPVVLIHGAGGHHLYWPPQIRRLHDQRVFALDLPGHGKSDGIGRHRVADYVQDVLEFLNERRLNAAVWIGHSMGGAIALEAAMRFPQRVLGLVLIGSGARLRVDPMILRAATQEGSFPAAIRLIAARSFAAATAPRLKELASQRMEEIRQSVLLGDLLACDEYDVMDGLASVRAPTLIVCGSEDQMTPPRFSSLLHERIQGSGLQLIAHAGHMVMLEKPDEVAAALEGFLGAIPYEPGR